MWRTSTNRNKSCAFLLRVQYLSWTHLLLIKFLCWFRTPHVLLDVLFWWRCTWQCLRKSFQAKESYGRNVINFWTSGLKSLRQQSYSLLQEKVTRENMGGTCFSAYRWALKATITIKISPVDLWWSRWHLPKLPLQTLRYGKGCSVPIKAHTTQVYSHHTTQHWLNAHTTLSIIASLLNLLKGWFSKTLVHKIYRQVIEK